MPKYRIQTKATTWINSRGEKSPLPARSFVVEAKDKQEARQKARRRMYGFQQPISEITKE